MSYYYTDNGYSGFSQIPIRPEYQEKTTFTCPYDTYAYHRMPFGLCNGPPSFQKCVYEVFPDYIEKIIEVFMDNFYVRGTSFDYCLYNLTKIMQRCEEIGFVLNWEKSHFMVIEGVLFGHRVSVKSIEINQERIEVIENLPYPQDAKGMQTFMDASFYKRFLQNL